MNTKKLMIRALLAVLLVPVAARATIYTDWNHHRYVMVQTDEPIKWEDAADAAADALGGYLVRIESALENQFVFDFITSTLDYDGNEVSSDGFRWYWLGGWRTISQEIDDEGHLVGDAAANWGWAAADGEDPILWGDDPDPQNNYQQYRPWDPATPEPNNAPGDTTGYRKGLQNYLHFSVNSTSTAPVWDDVHQYGKTPFPEGATSPPYDPPYSYGMRGYIIEYSYLAPVPAPSPLLLLAPALLAFAAARRWSLIREDKHRG